nr:MAG TPA: hypothetical protein [Caudoviricetes sp.]
MVWVGKFLFTSYALDRRHSVLQICYVGLLEAPRRC